MPAAGLNLSCLVYRASWHAGAGQVSRQGAQVSRQRRDHACARHCGAQQQNLLGRATGRRLVCGPQAVAGLKVWIWLTACAYSNVDGGIISALQQCPAAGGACARVRCGAQHQNLLGGATGRRLASGPQAVAGLKVWVCLTACAYNSVDGGIISALQRRSAAGGACPAQWCRQRCPRPIARGLAWLLVGMATAGGECACERMPLSRQGGASKLQLPPRPPPHPARSTPAARPSGAINAVQDL